MIEDGIVAWFNFNPPPLLGTSESSKNGLFHEEKQAGCWAWGEVGSSALTSKGPILQYPNPMSKAGLVAITSLSLKHQGKLKWWRMSQVKLGSQVSKCGSGPVTQPSSVPLQGSQAGLGWEGRWRFWNASQEVKSPGQDLDQQDTSPGTDTVIL